MTWGPRHRSAPLLLVAGAAVAGGLGMTAASATAATGTSSHPVDDVTVTGVQRVPAGLELDLDVVHRGAGAQIRLDALDMVNSVAGGRDWCSSIHVVDTATGRVGLGQGAESGGGCQLRGDRAELGYAEDGDLVRVTVLVADPGGRAVDVVVDDQLLATGVALKQSGPSGDREGVIDPQPRIEKPTSRIWVPEARFTRAGASVTGAAVDLSTDVLFAFDSDVLGPDAGAALDVAVQQLQAQPSRTVSIVGHTDSQGASAYNLGLSQRRAEAVRAALAARLGAGWTLNASGVGETQPVADETRPTGVDAATADAAVAAAQKLNRRVAVTPG